MLINLLAFIAVLGILVAVHELGHFLAARAVGMRVDEFSVGFPPRIYKKQLGETKFSIGAIPLGGYVRVHGEGHEPDAESDPRAFDNRPVWARAFMMSAGVLMNLALAFVVLTAAFSVGFSSTAQDLEAIPGSTVLDRKVYAAGFLDTSPARAAGVAVGDKFTQLNGQEVTAVSDVVDRAAAARDAGAREVELTLERNGEEVKKLVPVAVVGPALGVYIQEQVVARVPVWRAPEVAMKESLAILDVTWTVLKRFGAGLVGGQLAEDVSGPIGIYQATGNAAQSGWIALTYLTVALSLNLALFNILPIPALDGGKLVFLAIEGIFRRRVIPRAVEQWVGFAGFVFVIGLILVLSVRDIVR